MQTRRVLETLAAAARWIDRTGLALLFPKADVVLPSLWEQVTGLQHTDWNAEGINFLWWAKDVLPDEGRAVVGRQGRGRACPRWCPSSRGRSTRGAVGSSAGRPRGSSRRRLLARKWKLPKRLPPRDDARRELAGLVLRHAGELTVADLTGVFGWRRKEAAAILDEIAEGRDAGGFTIYAPR